MVVKDLMNSHVITVSSEDSLCKALQLMLRFHLDDVVVVKDEDEIIGIVTYQDLIKKLLPTQQEIIENEYLMTSPAILEERITDVMDMPVKEVMTTNVKTVTPQLPMIEAGALMNAYSITKLPVVEGKKVVGIITFTDIAWGLFMKTCELPKKYN